MEKGKRIHFLDELRGFCILLMVAYHAFYTFGTLFGSHAALSLLAFFMPCEPFFAAVFILLCGFSCHLSKNNLKRGLLLGGVSVLLSLVMWIVMPSQMIWFGILHFLSSAILLYTALYPLLRRVPTPIALLCLAALFACTWYFPFYQGGMLGIPPFAVSWPTAWQALWFLMPLGIGFTVSADYFPLLPWIFCFLFGSTLGRFSDRLPAPFFKRHCRPLAFVGRHSLVIYLAHQPLIYGIAQGISLLCK